MFKQEWRKLFHEPGMLIVLVAIALIPAIYCWLYLSSMWNTYGKMDDIPVALVNHDHPQRYHGKRIAIGQHLVTGLKKSDSLNYSEVSHATAKRGLRDGKYFMIVQIPRDFSKDATTLLTSHPTQLNLHFQVSSGRNFIVSKMTAGAATAIENKLAKQTTAMYATILLNALHNVNNGLGRAATGSQTLSTGSQKLLTGNQRLQQGATKLTTGLQQLNQAVPSQPATAPLKTGVTRLLAGNAGLTAGLAQSNAGLTQLSGGARTLATALTTSHHKVAQIQTATRNAQLIANPVKVTRTDTAKVPNNGIGMAPFAIAIGLFVGGIALGTMYDAYTPEHQPHNAWRWWLAKASVIGSVGLLQASLLAGVLSSPVNVQAKSFPQLWGLLILGSLTFLSLIFALRIILGGFGTWLVTIILVLQLSASSGLYPVELTSQFARNLTPFLPMTYLIDGLRHAISLGGTITTDCWVLVAIILAMNLLIWFKFHLDVQKQKFAFLDEPTKEETV